MTVSSKSLNTLTFSVALVATIAAQPAAAWTRLGHMTIAQIAEIDLRQKLAAKEGAKASVYWKVLEDLILADPSRIPSTSQPDRGHLSDIATWADDIRRDNNGDGVRDGDPAVDHTTRIPINASVATPAHPCSTEVARCADEAVNFYAPQIARLNAYDVSTRQTALKYVVHLVGDLHQPLHGSDPIGYDWVDIEGRNLRLPTDQMLDGDLETNANGYYNIHAIWDYVITYDYSAAHSITNYASLATDVMIKQGDVYTGGTPRDWAQESSNIARDFIYKDAGYPTPPGCNQLSCLPATPLMLDANYTTRKYPVVQQRLKQAGLRLSCVLYSALTGKACD
jgi:hypothetical protein